MGCRPCESTAREAYIWLLCPFSSFLPAVSCLVLSRLQALQHARWCCACRRSAHLQHCCVVAQCQTLQSWLSHVCGWRDTRVSRRDGSDQPARTVRGVWGVQLFSCSLHMPTELQPC
ncbi:hypothetical protein COO60DRAFT_757139 [Scenedesmus sp. NREL 46B-D3]|nr:hypothetical protein COO60DRAFT_757139 [Scenedesmus sp. NREL 46B-D3]